MAYQSKVEPVTGTVATLGQRIKIIPNGIGGWDFSKVEKLLRINIPLKLSKAMKNKSSRMGSIECIFLADVVVQSGGKETVNSETR